MSRFCRRKMLELNEIRSALKQVSLDTQHYAPHPRHASVAMIFAESASGLELCFIRRAEREGDPWSGQVAFPGGRASASDPDPCAVAERETLEEIGLPLAPRHRLGPLPLRVVENNIKRAGLTLWPHLYHVESHERITAAPRIPAEVASVFWVPVDHLFDAQMVIDYEYPGLTASVFPGIRFGDHVIWGLTLNVLASFATVMRRKLPALP